MFQKKIDERVSLLNGTAIKTEKGYFYIKNGNRIRIPTRRVLASWRFYKIVNYTEESVAHLPILGKLGFREGTLLWCIADANYYIVTSNKLYHVTDPEVLRHHGLKLTDAMIISRAERDLHGRLND